MFSSLRESLSRVGRWPRLLAVTACLVLAAVSAVDATRRPAQTATPTAGRTAPVVVAARDLPAGHAIVRRDVTLMRWPLVLRPPGAAHAIGARVGARLAGPIRVGEAVTTSRLVGTALTDGLARGVAAVPISVSEPQASDLVRPGDEIELLATPRDDLGLGGDGNRAGGSVTVVARRLLVLASARGTGASSLIVAADPATTLAIARARSVGVFLAVPVAP